MLITSDFTLEFNKDGTPNLPRTPVPAQLNRLGVDEPVWARLHSVACGVAERAVKREQNKKELDNYLLFIKGTREQRALTRARIAEDKKGHDENTRKGWTNLLNECTSELGTYGVFPSLLIDAKVNLPFGLVFRCDATRLMPNKLKLEFSERAKQWSWPRNEVPAEQARLHVTKETWKSVWDMASKIYTKTLIREGMKDSAQDMQELRRLDREIEEEWGRLEEFAEDAFYLYGMSARLCICRKNTSARSKYGGLVFRFQPLVSSAVPVISSVATVAAVIPSAPIQEDIMVDEELYRSD